MNQQTDIENKIISVIRDLTQDWGLELDGEINLDTYLVKDMEFASVDIIQLCVALEQCFDQKMGFQDLLMAEGSYRSDLVVAQLVNFVSLNLTGS